MRRMLYALVLMCALGMSLATVSTTRADDATGPVAFTVHAAYCPLADVWNPEVGLYDACHRNSLEGQMFILDSSETGPVSFATDADGVGSIDILDGSFAITQVTLSVNTATIPDGGYAYCSDQVEGAVLYDGAIVNDGLIPLFTIDAGQEIVCDWYIYADALPAG